MIYRLLADATVVCHLLFVVFVVCGGLALWRWPQIAWVHVPAVAWAVGIEWIGGICPLTPLEFWLRAQAGLPGRDGDFLDRFVLPILYPTGLTRGAQVVLGSLALALNLFVYGAWWRRRVAGGRRSVE